MFSRGQQAVNSPRDRLAQIVGAAEIPLVCAIFERSQNTLDSVDARQFRIDYRDQRDAIRKLSDKGLVVSVWEPTELYRLPLVALPLIETDAARSLLADIDRLLAYFERQYVAQRDQQISVDQISVDLKVPRETICEALGYLIDTPVIGARRNGTPESKDWWMTPMEQSLEYPNLDALLNQLMDWLEQRDRAEAASPPIATHIQVQPSSSPSTLYDRLINWMKNQKLIVATLIAFVVIAGLADAFEVMSFLYTQFVSLF